MISKGLVSIAFVNAGLFRFRVVQGVSYYGNSTLACNHRRQATVGIPVKL